ncbi:hypothetical protein DCAR_0414686 [Daucus carota subsp. sativus]|nr:hypothetical protein DCAR_0414686 [Daucus carota subsp. sativus]
MGLCSEVDVLTVAGGALETVGFFFVRKSYGRPEKIRRVENFELKVTNPYGRNIARDIQKADSDWQVILLRYSNPVEVHESDKLGEDSKGIPNNLLPYIQQVVVGRLNEF